MNPRWLLIRRLRGPVFLLTFGLTALLHQWGTLSFGQSWPLYLIVAGVMTLLERAAFVAPWPNSGDPYGGGPNYGQPYGQGYPTPAPSYAPGAAENSTGSTAIVPSHPHDITLEGRR